MRICDFPSSEKRISFAVFFLMDGMKRERRKSSECSKVGMGRSRFLPINREKLLSGPKAKAALNYPQKKFFYPLRSLPSIRSFFNRVPSPFFKGPIRLCNSLGNALFRRMRGEE